MKLKASAILAMEGHDIDAYTKRRLLDIIGHYEMGLLVSVDCAGCQWKNEIGCTHNKTCRREQLVDYYYRGTEEGLNGADRNGKNSKGSTGFII